MALDALASDWWPLLLLSGMIGIAIFPLALFCSFLYAALSRKFENVPKPAWFLLITLLGTFIGILALYLYLDVTFAELIQTLPSQPAD